MGDKACTSREDSDALAFGFELMVLAEASDVFLHLDFEIGERGFADVGEMNAFLGRVQRTAGKS